MIYISGAGIAGLTLANAFEKYGISYRVLERATIFTPVGAGIWLAPNALKVLDGLGLLDAVQKAGNPINTLQVAKPDLRPISTSSQKPFLEKLGYNTIAIHRARLQEILLRKIPSDKIMLNFNVEQVDPKSCQLVNELGTSVSCEAIIGADGLNSIIRKTIFPDSAIRYSGQTCWRGITEMQLDDRYINTGLELWGNQRRFGVSQIDDKRLYWFAVVSSPPGLQDKPGCIKERLLDQYVNFHPLIHEIIESTNEEQVVRHDLYDLYPLKRWYKGKICLIGDAAHAATPNLGQGGAQAIEDAFVLSKILEKYSPTNAYPRFQKIREKKVRIVVKQSRMIGQIAHMKSGRRIRNKLMSIIPPSLAEKRLLKLYTPDKV